MQETSEEGSSGSVLTVLVDEIVALQVATTVNSSREIYATLHYILYVSKF